jgi:hypothetical protein
MPTITLWSTEMPRNMNNFRSSQQTKTPLPHSQLQKAGFVAQKEVPSVVEKVPFT